MEHTVPLLGPEASQARLKSEHEDLEPGIAEQWKRVERTKMSSRWWKVLGVLNYTVPWTVAAILAIDAMRSRTWGANRFQQTRLFPSQMTYSPAQSEIEYVVKTFDHNLVNSPVEFQHPGTVDQAWASLYDVAGATALSGGEARKIPNATISSTDNDAAEYLVQLGVFHQLHCLVRDPIGHGYATGGPQLISTVQDVMRQALEPFYGLKNDSLARLQANHGIQQQKQLPKRQQYDQRTPPEEPQDDRIPWKLIGNVKHLNHCLNALRQSIMCHSDVSVLVWQWYDRPEDQEDPFDELRSHNYPFTNIPHTCRNFDKISEWARSRRATKMPDFTTQPEEPSFRIPSWP